MRTLSLVAAILVMAVAGCGDDDLTISTEESGVVAPSDAADAGSSPEDSAPDDQVTTVPADASTEPDQADSVETDAEPDHADSVEADEEEDAAAAEVAEKLVAAEAFLDAFYSFDQEALVASMREGADTDFITYYQGWADAANYDVMNRSCETAGARVRCDVTVRDDFAQALDLGFDVTDTFTLTYRDGEISSLWTESDDPPVVGAMFTWLQVNRPEIFDGPCDGMFFDGPTPGDCASAVLAGAEEFVLTDEYAAATG